MTCETLNRYRLEALLSQTRDQSDKLREQAFVHVFTRDKLQPRRKTDE
jgi:hypothetical protein